MTNEYIKICKHGIDGFGHQLEGMLRLISLSLNNKAQYMYELNKHFSFEHSNFNIDTLHLYLSNALEKLSNIDRKVEMSSEYKIVYHENRTFETIIHNDYNYANNIYIYDGVGCGRVLPPNFEDADELKKSLPSLRNAFVLENQFLPPPTYKNNIMNVVCHIRLGDAVGTRLLDNNKILEFVKQFQQNTDVHVTIHSDGDISYLTSENTTLHDKNTDVLNILSDFIHADILIINYSALSIVGHLLAKDSQQVICPNVAGPTFHKRILHKCIKMCDYDNSQQSFCQ